ncbi:MAG: glycosyl hydrolase family 30 [Opitutae bacterium]|nr:glycosyl hydrolase family 30 [Opitutae bacterium]
MSLRLFSTSTSKLLTFFALIVALSFKVQAAPIEVYQTGRQGDRLQPIEQLGRFAKTEHKLTIELEECYQTVVGFGGAFTEAGAHALSELSGEKRAQVLRDYFSPEGAHLTLTRTHIASCDFSLKNYTYAPVPGDVELNYFSIEPDQRFLLPMIKDSLAVEGADFKIMASPWTAPPWMKTNNHWNGGELKKEYYSVFADYFVKYIQAYAKEGVDIWGLTPTNEPLGNNSSWESVHFSAEEMREFIGEHLGPTLDAAGLDMSIWAFDQNRDHEMLHWAETIYNDPLASSYVDGLAVHWYQSTVDVGGKNLDIVHNKFPYKGIIHSEGCLDSIRNDEPIGDMLEDDWYWRPEATDWGFFWAPDKSHHPKYRPFYRYVRDLIQGFNHNLNGWIDWNLVLNSRGGPNHANNFCGAPILVDSGRDYVYYTPLYYAIAHFSKYVRPDAKRVGLSSSEENPLWTTAFLNTDGSIVFVAFNPDERTTSFSLSTGGKNTVKLSIPGQALQTVIFR